MLLARGSILLGVVAFACAIKAESPGATHRADAIAPVTSAPAGTEGATSDPVPSTHEDIVALERALRDPKPQPLARLVLIERLGLSRDRSAVPALLEVLRQPSEGQPVEVHRAAVTALGRLRDPSVVDDLLEAQFRIADRPTTKYIGERVKVALASIGAPAVAPTLRMLDGKHADVERLVVEHGLTRDHVVFSAASVLGLLRSSDAVEPLLSTFPDAGCKTKRAARTEAASAVSTRAVVAEALGRIGDQRAVPSLCGCLRASRRPEDAFPIAEALGRIGGRRAVECLLDAVRNGEYDRAAVASPEFVYELRWEAARFAILAATPSDTASITSSFAATRSSTVKDELAQWQPGLDLTKTCGEDKACYSTALRDPTASWFARETAATKLARLAPGDLEIATEISNAFSVPDPDARTTMALLPMVMLPGQRCGPCAVALAEQLARDDGKLAAEFQLSVLIARYAQGALGENGEPAW